MPRSLPPCLLAHIHLGKRGAQCIAVTDRASGLQLHAAPENPQSTFLASTVIRSRPARPSQRRTDLSLFPSFPFPSPELSLGPPRCWRGHSATRHHVTVSQTLSSHCCAQHSTAGHSVVPRLLPKSTSKSTPCLQQQTPTHASCAVVGTTVRSAELD